MLAVVRSVETLAAESRAIFNCCRRQTSERRRPLNFPTEQGEVGSTPQRVKREAASAFGAGVSEGERSAKTRRSTMSVS